MVGAVSLSVRAGMLLPEPTLRAILTAGGDALVARAQEPTMEERETRPDSYEDDVYGWSLRQAELLRAGRYDDVDMDNVAEEIESLGRAQAASLESCYRLIAAHLLKVMFQPERFTRGWQITIVRQRLNAQSCLKASPSLKPRRTEIFADAYRQARKLAIAETGLPSETFPSDPPFTLDELSDECHMPWTALAEPAPPEA